ncbi:P-II family nitrogen regulator [Thiotrichales bacterium 19S9-12]|nr:P-II family nitrogen regulator [Thiotrichales bacterium 19S9-11]MCF6811511.1 P-II family nitrogen regulator [Thiotrichales bacterium 19S9-12]
MKLITAIIRAHLLDDVRDALIEYGIGGITVTEVKGFGNQQGHTELYRGAEYAVDFLPKIKVEVATIDSQVEDILDIIIEKTQSGKIGDGKIFITPLDQVIRIRTQELGSDAL